MRHARTFAALGLLAVLAVPAAAQDDVSRYLGANIGVFFPSDGKLREALGDSWLSIGATAVTGESYARRAPSFDWEAISKSGSGNKVFMLAASYGFTFPLGQRRMGYGMASTGARPYFAVRAGLSYVDYAIGVGAARVGAKRIGPNANAELGINIGDRLNVSARYDLMPAYDGYGFSGLSLSLKYGLLRF